MPIKILKAVDVWLMSARWWKDLQRKMPYENASTMCRLFYCAPFPAGSQAVITFLQPSANNSPASKAGAARLAERVKSVGEPFLSQFEPGVFKSKLLRAGFTHVEFLTHDEAYTRYFVHGHQDLTCPNQLGIAHAFR